MSVMLVAVNPVPPWSEVLPWLILTVICTPTQGIFTTSTAHTATIHTTKVYTSRIYTTRTYTTRVYITRNYIIQIYTTILHNGATATSLHNTFQRISMQEIYAEHLEQTKENSLDIEDQPLPNILELVDQTKQNILQHNLSTIKNLDLTK